MDGLHSMDYESKSGSSGGGAPERGVWLLLPPETVPERWRDRAENLSFLPLLPGEAEELLGGQATLPGVGAEDERLLRMLADGCSVAEIAREVNRTKRSVERRLANLRKRLGVGSTAELALLAARRGL
jgi:DNA-binding CsgD family transcriptional regulator